VASLIIELPDELVSTLEDIAATRHVSIQQLALDRLSSLAAGNPAPIGSAAALLRAMREPPHLSSADVDEMDAAILAGRLPVRNARPLLKHSR